jgi:hypothetical protein
MVIRSLNFNVNFYRELHFLLFYADSVVLTGVERLREQCLVNVASISVVICVDAVSPGVRSRCHVKPKVAG